VRAIKFGGLILLQFCGAKCVNLNLISFRAEAEVHTVCLLLFPGQTSFVTQFDGSGDENFGFQYVCDIIMTNLFCINILQAAPSDLISLLTQNTNYVF
jgi:hypothetical protein